jgi:hypothetical protein
MAATVHRFGAFAAIVEKRPRGSFSRRSAAKLSRRAKPDFPACGLSRFVISEDS